MTLKISKTRRLGTPCCQSIRDFSRNCHSGSGARHRVVDLEGNRELDCVRKALRAAPQVQCRKCREIWRPVRESNPCRRREREATCCNSKELSGMDSTLPHLKDSRVRLLDA